MKRWAILQHPNSVVWWIEGCNCKKRKRKKNKKQKIAGNDDQLFPISLMAKF